MTGEVKSAQITISEHWHNHVQHKTVGKAPRWDAELGVVCACGEVLGWPDPEHKETLSQYTKRVASERVDQASAPGRVKGAFGTYGGEQVADPAPGPDDGPTSVHPDEEHDGDPGPEEPEVDWGEPPADEPDPEPLAIEDGDSEDVGSAPIPADAVPDERGNMISDGKSYGQPGHAAGDPFPAPANEAQVAPWGAYDSEPKPSNEGIVDTQPSGLVPWDGERPEADEPDPTPEEAAILAAEGRASARELIENPEVGSALVPYRGTPIMPTDAQQLDPLVGRLAPLDPSLPYTPQDVELKIVEIMRQLENSELFLRQQLSRLHQATHNHDFRYNLALAQSDQRAADQRKAEAWLATEKERHEMTEADMLVRALRDSQHNLRSQLSGFQSVARSLAVSMVNSLDGRERPPLPPEPPRYN
jgi:hypothetical protein